MDNVVLITGYSRGIGRALREAFTLRGDSVVGYSRSELGDLRDLATVRKLRDLAEEKKVNILVNNAGLYSLKSLVEETVDDIISMVHVNLIAPILITRALWPGLKERHGTVVNINSVAGRHPGTNEIIYRATKHGLTGFSTALYHDGKRDGVRVVDIPFGAVNTDMVKARPDAPNMTSREQQPAEAARVILRILSSSVSHEMKHFLLGPKIIDTRCGRCL